MPRGLEAPETERDRGQESALANNRRNALRWTVKFEEVSMIKRKETTTTPWRQLLMKPGKSVNEKTLVAAVRILSTTMEWQSTPRHEIYDRIVTSGERTTL
jgi:hypothetical protein